MTDYKLFEEYDKLPGVPPKLLSKVKKLCGSTYADLLFHIPHTVIDRRAFTTIENAESGKLQTLKVIVTSTKNPSNPRTPFKVFVTDKSAETLELLFFNVGNWIKKSFPEGKEMYISGIVESDMVSKKILHPEMYSAASSKSDIAKLEPVYPLTKGINSKMLSKAIGYAVSLVPDKAEFLPDDILNKYNYPSFKSALSELHNPTEPETLEIDSIYRKRLAFDELYAWQSVLIESRNRTKIEKGFEHTIKSNLESKLLDSLPFSLTSDQMKVIAEIKEDLHSAHPMLRLAQGDVGAGKTLVAFAVMMQAIENGKQACMMAPTEILARQHFEWMQELFWDFGISSHLLVGSVTKKQKDAIKTDMKNGNVDVIIGTHALVQEDVLFHNLWFVVIDEQHRFWVKQREVLESWLWNRSGKIPHSLNMTATPIPRTLALTLYWDQDLSVISEYPKWRKDIYTKVARDWWPREEVERFIRNQLEQWRQAFWISPLVEESEKIDLANAISTYETLVELFAPFKVWLLHGKMKAREKDEVMKAFSENKIQVLSSTSVVEVWVNVPNSTIMCIEWAERFWLSQLHQFRGRVWRWKYQSYCYLFPTKGNSTDRLKAMERTNNGFELAEIDLEIRWPGEVYGLRQSWVPDLKVADLRDLELISQIRVDIEEMFEDKKQEMQA